MKTSLILLAAVMMSASMAQAWVSTPTAEKEHKFVYHRKDANQQMQTFEFSSTAPTYEEAYEKAAQACYRHFRDETKETQRGRHLSEDQGLDIIDTCANPRSL